MTPWLDFSGAPPLLIPAELLLVWRGHLNKSFSTPRDVDFENPTTDYDRACVAAWNGKSILSVGSSFALSLYTEFDQISWDKSRNLVGCGSWWPTDEQLQSARWEDPLQWHISHTEYLLINSAEDGAEGKTKIEHIQASLPFGLCVIKK